MKAASVLSSAILNRPSLPQAAAPSRPKMSAILEARRGGGAGLTHEKSLCPILCAVVELTPQQAQEGVHNVRDHRYLCRSAIPG